MIIDVRTARTHALSSANWKSGKRKENKEERTESTAT
jgi:hypothetical protein